MTEKVTRTYLRKHSKSLKFVQSSLYFKTLYKHLKLKEIKEKVVNN